MKLERGNLACNTWATDTPVTGGGRVFFAFGNVGVFCHDFEGKQIWPKELKTHKVCGNWGT
ncbi:MAG: hypothetical protein ACKVY0_17515 [Prosthecobacter sp.]|uniref:hypothetical protein n=1 Tax=Prosthecobacter sp. TaxID=1965333 RepID=UPI0038FF9D38